jgi:hypothetical protein
LCSGQRYAKSSCQKNRFASTIFAPDNQEDFNTFFQTSFVIATAKEGSFIDVKRGLQRSLEICFQRRIFFVPAEKKATGFAATAGAAASFHCENSLFQAWHRLCLKPAGCGLGGEPWRR